MGNEKILVIDDSPEILGILSEFLRAEGYEIDTAEDGAKGISLIERNFYDLILTDLKMPDTDGMAVLKYICEHSPDSLCIILTGYGTVKNAVEAIKMGAFDYLTKPVKTDEILVTFQRAFEYRDLKRENVHLRNQLKKKYRFENIIGDSEKIQKVFEVVEKVADTDSTVLILGESGTGKELIAKAIHYNSYRREKPFVPVNCAAIPGELLESELFGHEKGSFTNAIRMRIGRFELANGGTVFLDEIGDMNPVLQSKLLRVLQERQFERVGGIKTIKTDIRIIAATHQNLKVLVQQRKFREDLYYRLNVIPLGIPPLRERKTDIPLLAHYFLDHFNKRKKKKIRGIREDAMARLMQYDWPGNVRELENTIERVIILLDGDLVTPPDLPDKFQELPGMEPAQAAEIPESGISLDDAVSEFERKLILQALIKTGWVKNKAAQLLNLNRTTLIEKIKRQNLQPPNS
ncbi:MAG: Two-component, sigma54 specific, transcriptional regulator, Fis family [Deltaproteobacteria bacterium]|nr:Two-component, sigma54 specific, transcriptional regulator, Fis family [Deltaproteobacteria bacterium]